MELCACDQEALQEDDALLDAVSGLVADSHLLERATSSAERFVYGVEDGEVVTFASLKNYRGRDGIEVYYLVVDPVARGEGYGGDTFDRALDEAEDMAENRGFEHVYMDVWDAATGAYDEVKEVVEAEEDFFSDSFMPQYCDEVGVTVDDMVEENTAMKHLAESRGFAERESNGSFRKTEYERAV